MNENETKGMIAVPGGSVFWRRFGDGGGVPLLMIHGGPGMASNYLDNLSALGDERPVFTWDQLDCGRSDMPKDTGLWTLERFVGELDAVRRALTPGPVHILGHSWGATLAMEWIVTKRPDDIASVVFASPCISTPQWIEDTRALISRLSPGSQAAIAEAEQTGSFQSPGYQAVVWGEWLRKHIVRQLPDEALGAMLGSLAEMNVNLELLEYMWGPSDFTVTGTLRDHDRTTELGMLNMPVLYIIGEYDEVLPETIRKQAALTPNAKTAIIPGSGHLTMIDAPEETNAAIRNFLAAAEVTA